MLLQTTGPAITASLSAPQATIGYDGTASITLTDSASDPATVSSLTFTLDGARSASNTINIYALAAGTHTAVITAVDALGNQSTDTLTFAVHPSVSGIQDLIKYDYSVGDFSSSTESSLLGYLSAITATSTPTQIQSALTNEMNAAKADSTGKSPPISSAVATLLSGWAQDLYARE